MEQRIKDRYDEGILQVAMSRYAIGEDQIRPLDGFESFIFECRRDDEDIILRIGHSLRRSPRLIHGEVDWINYLADGGAGVARAIRSPQGNLVELIDDGQGGQFLATAFVRAPGRPPRKADWTAAFARRYGQSIGRMHALARTYQPTDPAWRRPEWDAENNLEIERLLLPADEGIAWRYRDLKAHLDTLPRDDETYRLIHQDAHAGNFFVDDAGQLTFFDFDDCVYSWFIYDIAMVLFYAITGLDDPQGFAAWFLPQFLAGYRRENRLDPAWLAELPHFLKLREIDLYAVILRSFDMNALDENPWVRNYLTGRRERLEQGLPYIDFDFASLASHL